MGGGGGPPELPAVHSRSPGASLLWLRGGGLTVSAQAPSVAGGFGGLAVGGGGGGGDEGVGTDSGPWRLAGGYPGALACSSLPPYFRPLGAGLSFGPSPTAPPLLSLPSPRRVAPAGGDGGGPAGAVGGGPGQR